MKPRSQQARHLRGVRSAHNGEFLPLRYAPLQHTDSIRVLDLRPGRASDPIICGLREVRLSAQPRFEAISYVWGDPDQKRDITCNGVCIQVTVNLFEALHSLRYRWPRSRTLWADAVCINQSDLQERGQQVNMMGDIYAKATNAVVWLGRDENGTATQAFKLVKELARAFDYHGQDGGNWPGMTRIDPPLDVEEQTDISKLLERPWFTRVWVIQEVSIAKHAKVIYGDAELSWRKLFNAMANLNFSSDIEHASLRSPSRIVPFIDFWLPISHPFLDVRDSAFALLRILDSARSCNATDARDRIFAFLGFWTRASEGTALISADYTKSLNEVYLDFATRFLSLNTGLDIFFAVQHVPTVEGGDEAGSDDGHQLPSWVPDWRQRGAASPLALRLEWGSGAAGDEPCVATVEDRSLIVRGFVLANVSRCTDVIKNANSDRRRDARQIDEAWKSFSEVDTPYGSRKDAGLTDSFSLCLTADTFSWNQRASDNLAAHRRTFQAWRIERSVFLCHEREWNDTLFDLAEALDDGEDQREQAEAFQSQMERCTHNRKVFQSNRGHFGLGPATMGSGDLCCILYGASFPMIIRPVPGKHDVFALVGEAYVHGVMDGEALGHVQAGQVVIRDFQLG